MDVPLVLFPNVILFAEIDQVGDRLGGEELETIDDFNLGGELAANLEKHSGTDQWNDVSHGHSGALLPPRRAEFVIERIALYHHDEKCM